jgi:hypothetical protein
MALSPGACSNIFFTIAFICVSALHQFGCNNNSVILGCILKDIQYMEVTDMTGNVTEFLASWPVHLCGPGLVGTVVNFIFSSFGIP